MSSKSTLVLDRVLRVMAPLVRLLVKSGVTYPAFATALKRVFLDAAQRELQAQGMAQTDSAITLLSGVHRRDVRQLLRGEPAPETPPLPAPLGLAGEVVARWLTDPAYTDRRGRTRALARGDDDFGALVAAVSRDVRPRAVLDELLRLGAVREDDDGLHLQTSGLVPRDGESELTALFAANLHDHAAAAAANLADGRNFLEQAMYVDHITAESAARLQQAAVAAWKQALKRVLAEAQARYDADAAADGNHHRARFGVYFYSEAEEPK